MITIYKLAIACWFIFSFFKYVSIIWTHIYWPLKYGREYYKFIYRENFDKNIIIEANKLYFRSRKGFGDYFSKLPQPFNLLLKVFYSYPFVYLINPLLIGLLVYLELIDKNILLMIILFLLIGLFILAIQRIISYFCLGIVSYVDLIELSDGDIYDFNLKVLHRNFITFFIDIILIVITFAFIYFGIHQYYCKGGFENINSNHLKQVIDFIYFSIATITTTGYGDIVPKKDCVLTKTFVSTQMIFSFLYVIIILQLISITSSFNNKK